MGKYVWYSGAADYPLEKRKRIKENILKMLDAGGMMQIESVKNNNHELYVLSKPEKDQNNRILWNYNYFEDDMWETASLDCKDLQIYSNKVGNEEYKDVMIALYMLSELEDNDIGFTMCNGDIVSEEKYVGWINQILGTNYSFRKRFNLWENVEWYIENEKCEEMHISMKELFELIPKNLRYAAGGTELADLLWVINGTSSLLPRDLDPDSYAYEVWKCQRAIQEIFIKDLENEEEKILSLLQMPRNRRKSVMDPIMKKLAKFTLFLPARIVLFLYTEFTGDNFWEIWSAIKSGAPLFIALHISQKLSPVNSVYKNNTILAGKKSVNFANFFIIGSITDFRRFRGICNKLNIFSSSFSRSLIKISCIAL